MADSLDITDVIRLTGLTARALRFYETRGLIAPLRTASGRRHYGPAELERLHQILALKRAGLSLAQIQRLTANRPIDLRQLVTTQIEGLNEQAGEIAKALDLLKSILSRIDRREPIDVATFCSLIRQGDTTMTKEKWIEATSPYLTEEQREAFASHGAALRKEHDLADYAARWKALAARIKAALPLDPASEPAQSFLAECNSLLAPLTASVPQAMKDGSRNLKAHFEQWTGNAGPGFDVEVARFIQAAKEAAAKAGGA